MKEYFARVTENYDALSITIPPVAQYLHRMILRAGKPGTVVEIDLEEFQTWSAGVRNRRKGFSWKWIWQGVTSLMEKGLLEIVKKYNKRYLKVRAYYVPQNKQKTSHLENKTSQNDCQKITSNDANSYPSLEIQRTTNTHYHAHPVVEKNLFPEKEETNQRENEYRSEGKSPQRTSVADLAAEPTLKAKTKNLSEEKDSSGVVVYDKSDIPQEPEVLTQEQVTLLRECAGEGIVLHPKMKALLLATETQIVRDALEALKVFKEKKRVKNPNGFLRRGIDERWRVTPNESANSQPYSREFYRWYSRVEKGKPGGIIDCPAKYLPICMGEPMVRIDCKPEKGSAPYTLLPWREAALEFPVPEQESPAPPPTSEPDDPTLIYSS